MDIFRLYESGAISQILVGQTIYRISGIVELWFHLPCMMEQQEQEYG